MPVIAHPWARRRGRILDEAALRSLVEPGLLGIEVDHLDHAPDDRARLAELADELGLLSTGSSDYHGTRKTVRLGSDTTSPRRAGTAAQPGQRDRRRPLGRPRGVSGPV